MFLVAIPNKAMFKNYDKVLVKIEKSGKEEVIAKFVSSEGKEKAKNMAKSLNDICKDKFKNTAGEIKWGGETFFDKK